MAEAERGNSEAAAKRLEQLQEIPELSITEETISLADKLIKKGAVPLKVADDAMHIALAAVHGIALSPYLELPTH